MRFVPEATPEQLDAHKADFGKWVLDNGLRELIEAYAICLDQIHEECLRVDSFFGATVQGTGAAEFQRYGLYRKLLTLEENFGITTDAKKHLSSLTNARNCLSHRGGVVGRRDCNQGDCLILKYRKLRSFAKQPSGEEFDMATVILERIILREGAQIMIQRQEIEKSFVEGSVIHLGPEDIQGILWTVYQSAVDLRQSFLAFVPARVEANNSSRSSQEPK